jgi:hypothetical protein
VALRLSAGAWLAQLIPQFLERQRKIRHRLPSFRGIFPKTLANNRLEAETDVWNEVGERLRILQQNRGERRNLGRPLERVVSRDQAIQD